MGGHRSTSLAAAIALATATATARAEIGEIEVGGFSVEKEVVVPGSPDGVWDKFTGDVSPWWDHHFSKRPVSLIITAQPGGGFFEMFDHLGNGAKHADVIFARRGKELRMRGPLGFSGNALDMVHTFTFTAEGDSTRIGLKVNAVGQMEPGWAEAVDAVWDHFLVERFKAYVEGRLPLE